MSTNMRRTDDKTNAGFSGMRGK